MADTPNVVSATHALAAITREHGIRHCIVGYSGGMDSHVLLHCLAQTSLPNCRISAIYINHGLQSAATAWGEHCAAVCNALAVPFRTLSVEARPKAGESPEAVARHARYQALRSVLDAESAVLTAHHADDQAETLLLQLLRGAGIHGLAAMPALARLGAGWLVRPLLKVEHSAVLAYAQAQGLHWIEDTSNSDPAFDRNYLRHKVFPLLKQRWPAVQRSLTRSAQLCAEAAEWVDAQAAADLAQVVTAHRERLSITALRNLQPVRQRHLLRYWLRHLHLPLPDARQLQQLLHDVLNAAPDRNPCVSWSGAEVRRYRDQLYAMSPLPAHDPQLQLQWRSSDNVWAALELPQLGLLRLEPTSGSGLRADALANLAKLANGVLRVRLRQGGERFRPLGRTHSQELKKLLQQGSIPPWLRPRLPLLYALDREGRESALLAVAGLGIAADWAAGPGTPGWQLVFADLAQKPATAPTLTQTSALLGS